MALERPPQPSKQHKEAPDAAGIWYFTGTAIVPSATISSNVTFVHIETPRRFAVIETQYGLIPAEPGIDHAYATVTFVGWWLKQLGA